MEYKLKKEFLTRNESKAIIITAMKSFNNSDNLIGTMSFDYLSLEDEFFNSLGLICIEDFTDELKEELYNNGKVDEIIDSITNAKSTYKELHLIADKSINIGNILYNTIQAILDKLPDNKDLLKVVNKLPKEWKDVFSQYNSITGKNENDAEGEAK